MRIGKMRPPTYSYDSSTYDNIDSSESVEVANGNMPYLTFTTPHQGHRLL